MLTGTTPFADLKKKSFHAIRDAIRSRDPQIASTRVASLGETLEEAATNRDTDSKNLHRFLKGDLDWILCRCLNRQRGERYQSAGEVAREIRRHLDGAPVEAAAPTVFYRARKFTARNKALVAIAASLVVVLLSSSVFSSVMAWKANRMAEKAKEAELLANDRLTQVIDQRDRIAELERIQREQAAMFEAAANYNLQLFKRGQSRSRQMQESADKSQSPFKYQKVNQWHGGYTDNRAGRPNYGQIRMLQSLDADPKVQEKIANAIPDAPIEVNAMPEMNQRKLGSRSGAPKSKHLRYKLPQFPQNKEVEIVIIDGQELNCQTEFYFNLLEVQKQRFGENDPVVVQTISRIGESLNNEMKFVESEKFLRGALEKAKVEKAKLAELEKIRLHLAKSLSGQGKTRQAEVQLATVEEQAKVEELSDDAVELLKNIRGDIIRMKRKINREKKNQK